MENSEDYKKVLAQSLRSNFIESRDDVVKEVKELFFNADIVTIPDTLIDSAETVMLQLFDEDHKVNELNPGYVHDCIYHNLNLLRHLIALYGKLERYNHFDRLVNQPSENV